MKKISIVVLMVAATMALPTNLHAQSWGGLLKQAVEKVTSDASKAKTAVEEKAQSAKQEAADAAKSTLQSASSKITTTTQQKAGSLTGAASSLLGTLSGGNGLSSVAGNAVSTIKGWLTGSTNPTVAQLTGNWTYAGPAVKLQSDNLLAQAGGTLIQSTAESKIKEQLEKFGFTSGAVTMTFNADSTYKCQMGNIPQSGTYSLNGDKMQLKSLLLTVDATATISGNNLQLAVDADKILKLLESMGSLASKSATISTLTKLLESYDGLQIGMKFTKVTE